MIIAQPQTPRLKTKLKVDIPSNYSNTGSPVSPSSPAFSASSAYNASVPASPTFSGSWNVNKSQAELTSLLKEAYGIIREKERDLMLAAEIGKSLLENNIALKSKYENTIVQLQHLQRARSKASTFTIHHGEKNAVAIAPPNNSLETFMEEPLDYDESDSESLQGWSSSYDLHSPTSPGENPIKRKNRDQNSGLNYKDLENIKELESQNQDLQLQLDEAIREYNDNDKTSKNKVRKLESDLQHYQDVYSIATQKIEDLTKENERLVQKQKSDFWNIRNNKKSNNENDDVIETLLQKVHELEEQNELVEKAKTEIERRLTRTTEELSVLKEEFEDLYETSRDCERLRMDNREKDEHIAELRERLEEQYTNRSGSGMWSQKTSRANSISDGGGLMRNALRRLSDPDGKRDMFGGKPIKKTLLSELENELYRNIQMFQRDVKKGFGDGESPPFSPLSSEKDLHDFFISNGARLDDDVSQLDYLSDSEFSFLDEFEVDNEKAVRIREWFWKRWLKAVYRFLRMIWRWCRFIIILIAAVLMALYRGPDDILPDEVYN